MLYIYIGCRSSLAGCQACSGAAARPENDAAEMYNVSYVDGSFLIKSMCIYIYIYVYICVSVYISYLSL